ncbi:hypothetical protein SRB17_40380 [Streptomyces sp. RB17]|uniref:hypothetical protein n=1 Tax=Streptomyces sp. RB17 TaxID=2585197 RepID=UPI001305EFB2|nr:hypothetical protein [Streptomyces sp. RB17]MQY36041.1 hypothetical protein [Streptomyces sp. RB17]
MPPKPPAGPPSCSADRAGPARTGAVLSAGGAVALGRFGGGVALDAAIGGTAETSLRYDLPVPSAHGTLRSPARRWTPATSTGTGATSFSPAVHGCASSAPPPVPGDCRRREPSPSYRPRPGRRVLAVGDFDGDGRADPVARTYRGETKNMVALYRGTAKGLLAARSTTTFSTSEFLAP